VRSPKATPPAPERSGDAPRPDDLSRARASYARREWADAHRLLALADADKPLATTDLELFAWSASLIGRVDDFVRVMERLYQAHLDGGDEARAARSAFWLGLRLSGSRQAGRAAGWLSRAHRLVADKDCAERGYLLLSVAHRHIAGGDIAAAGAAAREAAAIGDRFGDADLAAFARCVQGRTLLGQGDVAGGLSLLDEAMVAATTGELAEQMTGMVYCSAIAGCRQVFAIDRSREWTAVLAAWCGSQPQLVAFSATCLVHRAELLQLGGAWPDAINEAQRASTSDPETNDADALAESLYQQAEVHRLRGDFTQAERDYRGARQLGRDAQPGLALLRLAQGRTADAASAIRAALSGPPGSLPRARMLPAYIEILLAAGDLQAAKIASEELEGIAASFNTDVLATMAAHARGTVELADGRAQSALEPLRRALRGWQQVGAPYIAARVRVALASACRALGDVDGAQLELELAREVFEELGAAPDVAALHRATPLGPTPLDGGLHFTPRELEVLRKLATGKTNKAIAKELFVSEKTIDRHVSNIFAKANVASRAAATAFAYQRGLV
jgi:DNA-binding NarL/FixJ family response regulator